MTRRVLFIGESVTLSHVARPVALAGSLDPDLYEVVLACDLRYGFLLRELPFPLIELKSAIPQDRLLEVLTGRQPLFDFDTLDSYVQEDLQLISNYQPDVIVGDMRQSLAVSARLAKVTYVTVVNAQWSSYSDLEFEIPDNPLEDLLGPELSQIAQRIAAPLAFAPHTMPLSMVSMKYGLSSTGWDIKSTYSLGDYVAYPDIPEILPTHDLPPTHSYIGPVHWSPAVQTPPWWDSMPSDRPIVYVNLGSSGQHGLLELVLDALANVPVTVIAATAGKASISDVPANAYLSDYLPGDLAAARARMVVCNGGNMSGQQALAAGAPILGIASNVDQLVFARAVAATGAGEVLRERDVDAASVRRLVWRMTAEQRYRHAASRIAAAYSSANALLKFPELMDRIFLEKKSDPLQTVAATGEA